MEAHLFGSAGFRTEVPVDIELKSGVRDALCHASIQRLSIQIKITHLVWFVGSCRYTGCHATTRCSFIFMNNQLYMRPHTIVYASSS